MKNCPTPLRFWQNNLACCGKIPTLIFWPDSEDSCLTWFQTWQCLFKELWYSLLIQSQITVDYLWDLESKVASSRIPECSVPIRSLKVSKGGTGHSSDEWPQVLWTAPDSRIVSAFLGFITELMSHMVLLAVDALSEEAQRIHPNCLWYSERGC